MTDPTRDSSRTTDGDFPNQINEIDDVVCRQRARHYMLCKEVLEQAGNTK